MKYPTMMHVVALAALIGAGGVHAQTRPAVTDSGNVAPVVTDTGPAPAQDRNSMGAIVLENSLVRAQRENAFERSSARTGVSTIGRGVVRATMDAQREADLAQAREAAAVELYRRGSGGLSGN
ncbi:MAG: hypothetical protein ABIR26_19855 [Ramlibacter sp.]